MGLADVDEEKLDTISVLLVKEFEGISLTPKRRSGPTAEDQHDRPIAAEVRQPDRSVPGPRLEREVG